MKMKFTDYFRLALKNIIHQRSRSMLAILAIVIGTASVTIMLSLVFGAKNFYYEQFKATGKLEQVVVSRQIGLDYEQAQKAVNCDSCNKLTNKLVDTIKSYDNVSSLSRTVDLSFFDVIDLNDKKQSVKSARGYEPNGVIRHIFLAGEDFDNESEANKIIIGQNYADQWGYRGNYDNIIGKEVSLVTSNSFTGDGATLPDPLEQFNKCRTGCAADEVAKQQPTMLEAVIVGVQSDEPNAVLLPLKWGEKLLKTQRYEITKEDQVAYAQAYEAWDNNGRREAEPTPKFTLVSNNPIDENGYTAFIVKTNSTDNTDAVAKQIRELGIGAVSAKSYIRDQLRIFNVLSLIFASIGSIALFVAAIGIINTMVMAVLERTREIGVMRAVGAKRSTVSRLFTLEASMIGFLGGTLGVAFGYSFIMLANFFVNAQLADNFITGRNIISLPLWVFLVIIIATTIIGMLAGLYPAHRAARLNPVEALRHE